MTKLTRPGSASNYAKQRRPRDGRISENRFVWARTVIGQFIGMIYDNNVSVDKETGEEVVHNPPENGPDIYLILPQQGRQPIKYCLTALSAAELKVTRQLLVLLFDLAEPICEGRDRMAQDAYDEGDDSFSRVYREVPQFVVREGPLRTHYEGLYDGLESILERAGHVSSDEEGLRKLRDELANRESSDSEGENDGTQIN